MIAIAPCDVITVIDERHARVIAVYPFRHLRVSPLKADGFRVDVPVDAVGRKSGMERHPAVLVVHTENPGETVLERDYGGIEDAIALQ